VDFLLKKDFQILEQEQSPDIKMDSELPKMKFVHYLKLQKLRKKEKLEDPLMIKNPSTDNTENLKMKLLLNKLFNFIKNIF